MTQAMQTGGRWHEWTIGDRLRAARESVTDKQADFAELLTVSRQTISRYENGLGCKPLVVRAWAMATGFDYDWLMTGDVPRDEGGSTQSGAESPWTLRFPAAA